MGAALPASTIPALLDALRAVPDPRHARGRRYTAAALLTLAVCAMVSGSRSLYAIAQWGRDHNAADVRAALGITRAETPSVATLFRLFRDVDRAAFETVLARWVQAHGLASVEALALDGKTVRGIHGEEVPGVHLVAAFAHGRGDVLGEKGGPSRRAN